MTGLDTNILIRFFVRDDPAQCQRVDTLMRSLSSEQPGWISIVALVEFVWVLGSTYKRTRADIGAILDYLLSRQEIAMERADLVHRSLRLFRNSNIGFADCFIALSCREAGCGTTYTLDEVAAKTGHMTLLP